MMNMLAHRQQHRLQPPKVLASVLLLIGVCVIVILFLQHTVQVSYLTGAHVVASTNTIKHDTHNNNNNTHNTHNNNAVGVAPFEMVVTLLHNKTPSWSGRMDRGSFLVAPEVEDLPVTIFIPDAKITRRDVVVTTNIPPSDHPFPYLHHRTGPVHYRSIRDGKRTQEVTGYLHFIIQRYDNLPNVTIFLHSGPERHGERILESIRHVVDHWTPDQIGFLHLNYEILVCRAVKKSKDFHKSWKILGFDRSHHPHHIAVPCCAQFMVTKERILLRPKSFYQRFLNEAYRRAAHKGGYSLALFAEYHWHLIFGEPPILSEDRQVVHYMKSNWRTQPVHPAILYNPIPSLPYSQSMKPWYEQSVAYPNSYFPIVSTNHHEACPNGSQFM